jgi:hypothetical protein
MIEAIIILRPNDANRVADNTTPKTPIPIKRLDGNNMTPTVLESAKNKGNFLTDIDAGQGFHFVSYAGLTRVSIPLHKKRCSEHDGLPGRARQ